MALICGVVWILACICLPPVLSTLPVLLIIGALVASTIMHMSLGKRASFYFFALSMPSIFISFAWFFLWGGCFFFFFCYFFRGLEFPRIGSQLLEYLHMFRVIDHPDIYLLSPKRQHACHRLFRRLCYYFIRQSFLWQLPRLYCYQYNSENGFIQWWDQQFQDGFLTPALPICR